jgi:NADPH-dependent curcumin reductase CurA
MSLKDARPATAHEWRLVRRPSGSLRRTDLELVDVGVPAPRPGELTVLNTHLSVDPYLRGRMDDAPSYLPPFALDAPLDAGAVGVVIESRSPDFAERDVVEHFLGLREVAVADAGAFSRIDLAGRRPEVYLGTLGAAGAVGGLAGQLARLRGAGRVIGSAGTAAKVTQLVEELGFDDAFDYHDGTAHATAGRSRADRDRPIHRQRRWRAVGGCDRPDEHPGNDRAGRDGQRVRRP